ncbi:hypothetical protein Tco_0748616 [Tanacetum coccineum]|uniref:Uncharacterized protein n=1 Tax=Tanacetum coccineum TaxID=301880 RepID=A0ABQ4YYW2_9ASTR
MDNSKHGNIPMQERLDLNKTQGASTPEEKYTTIFKQIPGKPHWLIRKNPFLSIKNTKTKFLVNGGKPEARTSSDCYCDADLRLIKA